MNDPWFPLIIEQFTGNDCAALDEPINENERVCCSRHVHSAFALGSPFNMTEGSSEQVVGSLISFNVICLFFVIVGSVLDKMKKL